MKEIVLTYFKGIAMGAADVVPGVSGGTIAFITGIYERLIVAIKSINLKALKLIFTGKFRDFWQTIDGTFLLVLFLGIATSFLSLAKLITFLLNAYPVMVWSFFFGLIIASTIFVGRTVKWNYKTVLCFLAFAALSFFITDPNNAPLNSTGALWYICLCGAVAICAMILPGISGSFILLLMGQYFFMMKAISTFDVMVILVFIAGAAIGLLSFANVLSWLFNHFKMITLSALTGFMFGSLNKIWPWKNTLTFYTKDGQDFPLVQENILPQVQNIQFLYAILFILLGLCLVFGIEFVAKKIKKEG